MKNRVVKDLEEYSNMISNLASKTEQTISELKLVVDSYPDDFDVPKSIQEAYKNTDT